MSESKSNTKIQISAPQLTAGFNGQNDLKILKETIIQKAGELATVFKKIVEEKGGKVEIEIRKDGYYLVDIDVEAQPNGIPNGFENKVRLTSHHIGLVDVPAIATSSSYWFGDSAEEFAKQFNICWEIYSQIQSKVKEVIGLVKSYLEIEDKLKKAKVKELAKEFMALPEEETIWRHGGLKIVKERYLSNADEALKGKTTRLRGGVSLRVRKEGRRDDFLWLDDYVTVTGRLMRKKFIRDYGWILGDKAAEVAEKLRQWKKEIEDEEAKFFREPIVW